MTSPLATWLSHLAPHTTPALTALLDTMRTRAVYQAPKGPLSDEDRQCCGAEWSVRCHGEQATLGRVMLAPLRAPSTKHQLPAFYRTLHPDHTPKLAQIVQDIYTRYPDVDILLGLETQAHAVRSKLYVLQPKADQVGDFDAITQKAFEIAQIDPTAFAALGSQRPAFFAIDESAQGRLSAKLYFSFQHIASADAMLSRLRQPALREVLAQIAHQLGPHNAGRLVITPRVANTPHLQDVTLHAHLADCPIDSPKMQSTWSTLKDDAATVLGRGLNPSYRSWLARDHEISESLYYTIAPTKLV